MSIFGELKRRNVFRVAVAYAVVAWLVIEVSDTVFPRLGLPEWTVTFVIALLLLGFPVALFFAWAYELTPEGLRREKDVARSESITLYTARKLDRAIMVVLALGLAVFAFDKFVLNPQRDAALNVANAVAVEEARQAGRSEARTTAEDNNRSIAVLAFDDMSPEGDQEYLSDGIAEELLNLLAKIPELRVISRSSAFSFKGQNLELTAIAKRLGVGHILEGSVRKAGNRIRITAQLIDARSDTHLWSETYDRTLDDVFAIQDDIAATVVQQLKITLLGQPPQVQTVDTAAYELFLQGQHVLRLNSADGFEQSIELFRQALSIEPDYAVAWSGLATTYVNQTGFGLRPAEEGYRLARQAAEQALAIDPGHARTHSILGWIAMVHDQDLAAAVRYFEQALALDPTNSLLYCNASTLMRSLGRLEKALELVKYCSVRDPLSPVGQFNLAFGHHAMGHWEEADAALQVALRLSPDYLVARYLLGFVLLMQGESQRALETIQQEQSEVFRLLGLVLAYHELGQPEASDRALAELIRNYERESAYYIACALAYRGEKDRAFEWLDKSVEHGDRNVVYVAGEPLLANIQDDPRLLPFLESIGKSPEQLAAIEFDVTLPGQ